MSANKFENLDPYTFITKHLVRSTKTDASPLVCIKSDNPKNGSWTPIALTEQTQLPDNANLYICISSCSRLYDPSSKFHNTYRASIECASQTHMFMLDDINPTGLNKLPLEPTWVIETSPDNYQVLYVLETPLDDIALANKITKELPTKISSADQNAKNCVRWARLPGGRNNKPENLDDQGLGFAVRIHTANPDLLYTTENVCTAFNLSTSHSNPTPTTGVPRATQDNAPIIDTAPTGWPRYLSALLAIPSDCDYTTWLNCFIALHPWGDQGFVALDEWSQLSTNPEHIALTTESRRSKFDSIQYDSSNAKGHTSVIGWPWLQATATNHGWDYNEYSASQLQHITDQLNNFNTEQEVETLLPQVQDAYLNAKDLNTITQQLRAWYLLKLGVNHTMAGVKKKLIDSLEIKATAKEWTHSLTDRGNLQRFETLYEEHLWYIEETKQFIHWINNKWKYITGVQELSINTIDQIPYLEQRALNPQEQKQLFKWRTTCGAYSHIRSLNNLVRDHIPMTKTIADLNTSKTLIGTPSSILNLETGIDAINTPDHLITMYTNVDLNPEVKCPRWDQFILEIMNGDLELAKFLQKLAGYALYGGNPDQLFIILEGHGANGKTTFVNVLQHVFGNYAATAAADTLTRPAFNKSGSSAAPDIVRLHRKRLVICNEWNEGTYINESLIKVLSGGGDEISVRALYSNKTIDYTPEFLIMLATNHRPNITGMDYGIWRRLLIIPFEVNFTDAEHIAQRDPHLEQYLKDNESTGILNWLIEGYQAWQEEGMGTSVETGIPAKLIQMKEQYHLDMDTVGQYLQELTENIYDNDELSAIDHKTKSVDLYRAYHNWSTDNGYKAKGSKSFSQTLIHRGFKQTRISGVRGFQGIRLLTQAELLDAEPRTIEGVTHDAATIN